MKERYGKYIRFRKSDEDYDHYMYLYIYRKFGFIYMNEYDT